MRWARHLSEDQRTGLRPLPKISEITNRARKTKSKTLAITARLPARVTNPRTPAIKARIANMIAIPSMGHSLFLRKNQAPALRQVRSGLERRAYRISCSRVAAQKPLHDGEPIARTGLP